MDYWKYIALAFYDLGYNNNKEGFEVYEQHSICYHLPQSTESDIAIYTFLTCINSPLCYD